MAKKAKVVDVKGVEKSRVMEVIESALVSAGFEVLDGVDYGFTKGTIVVRSELTDVQIKPITPKAGVTRYEEQGE